MRKNQPPVTKTTAGARVRPLGQSPEEYRRGGKHLTCFGCHGVLYSIFGLSQRTLKLPALSLEINQKMDDPIDSLAVWAAECSKAQVPAAIGSTWALTGAAGMEAGGKSPSKKLRSEKGTASDARNVPALLWRRRLCRHHVVPLAVETPLKGLSRMGRRLGNSAMANATIVFFYVSVGLLKNLAASNLRLEGF